MLDAACATPAEEVARQLASDPELGLREDDAETRLARVEPNRLERAERPAYGVIALRQFADPLVGLLIAATAVSLLIGEGGLHLRRPDRKSVVDTDGRATDP